MRAFRFIVLAAILAALLVLPSTNRTVQSVVMQQADQANMASTTDATYTSGSVDLEGVSETDTTTFEFTPNMESPPNPADSAQPSSPTPLPAEDDCTQPEVMEAP